MADDPGHDVDDDPLLSGARRAAGWLLRELDEVVDAALRELGYPEHEGAGPGKPLPPGGAAPAVSVPAGKVQQLITVALSAAHAAPDQPPPQQVVWQDADGEVLVHLDQTKVVMFNGLVLVALTLESDETGQGEIVVPFAVGSPGSPAGLVAVTETLPRGPAALVDRWGHSAVAAAWRALLDVCHGLALRSGVDTNGARLIPGAISTDGSALSVTPQARFAHDRVVGR